jgi:hypothetical protein
MHVNKKEIESKISERDRETEAAAAPDCSQRFSSDQLFAA